MKITRRQLRRIIREELFKVEILTESRGHSLPSCIKRRVHIGDKCIVVEIADTDFLRRKGLMFRKSMQKNEGMLFVFPDARKQNFWMKNTDIPLSIAFINPAKTITSIQDMEPHSLNEASSEGPVLYALEMNMGWFRENKVEVGDKLDF